MSIIFNLTDIARELGVSKPAVSMWQRRYRDTPAPTYTTPNGTGYWSADGRDRWRRWHHEHQNGAGHGPPNQTPAPTQRASSQ